MKIRIRKRVFEYTPGLLEWLFLIALGISMALPVRADIVDGTPVFNWTWDADVTSEEIDNVDFVTLYCTPQGGAEAQVAQRPAIPMTYVAADGDFPRGVMHNCSMDVTDLAGDLSIRSNVAGFMVPMLSLPATTTLRIASTPTRMPSFDWDPVTQREDGTAVTVNRYLMFCVPPVTPLIVVSAPGTSYTAGVGDFTPGTYSCTISAEGDDGQLALSSNAVAFEVFPGTQPPSVIINVQ